MGWANDGHGAVPVNTFRSKLLLAMAMVPTLGLIAHHIPPTSRSITIHHERHWSYDRRAYARDEELGFRYVPGEYEGHLFVDGVVRATSPVCINRFGNVGRAVADAPLLVVGDSFTANPIDGGIAWTDYLSESALNRARDGYGVLQMVHLAARDPRPRIIVAFITDDLTRDRWDHFSSTDLPRHALKDLRDDPQFSADSWLLNRAGVALVRIPKRQDMDAGQYIETRRDRQLLASLRAAMTRARYVELPMDLGFTPADWRDHDDHPNRRGAEKLAAAIAGALSQPR